MKKILLILGMVMLFISTNYAFCDTKKAYSFDMYLNGQHIKTITEFTITDDYVYIHNHDGYINVKTDLTLIMTINGSVLKDVLENGDILEIDDSQKRVTYVDKSSGNRYTWYDK